MKPMFRIGLLIAALTAAIDQAVKQVVIALLLARGSVEVIPGYFDLVMVWNRGISFGLLGGGGALPPWVLSAVAVAICIGLGVWLRRATHPLSVIGIGLVIGGAIGNVIDRARWGAVFDFADFHVGEWRWPAFNVADSAIVVGVGMLLVESALASRSAPKR